jgi:hypothetical protein
MDTHQLDLRNSHSRAKVAKNSRDNMRWALGVDATFVEGSSLQKLTKAGEEAKSGAGGRKIQEEDEEDEDDGEKNKVQN